MKSFAVAVAVDADAALLGDETVCSVAHTAIVAESVVAEDRIVDWCDGHAHRVFEHSIERLDGVRADGVPFA